MKGNTFGSTVNISTFQTDFTSVCEMSTSSDYLTVLDTLNEFFGIDQDLDKNFQGYGFSDLSCKKSGDKVFLEGTVDIIEVALCLSKFLPYGTSSSEPSDEFIKPVRGFILLSEVRYMYDLLLSGLETNRCDKDSEGFHNLTSQTKRYVFNLDVSDVPYAQEIIDSLDSGVLTKQIRDKMDASLNAMDIPLHQLTPAIYAYFDLIRRGFRSMSQLYSSIWSDLLR